MLKVCTERYPVMRKQILTKHSTIYIYGAAADSRLIENLQAGGDGNLVVVNPFESIEKAEGLAEEVFEVNPSRFVESMGLALKPFNIDE